MRQALLSRLPDLTRFTFGAVTPLTVESYTLREISAYLRAMDRHKAEEASRREQ